MVDLRSAYLKLTPKTKNLIVIGGSLAALGFVIWLFQSDPKPREFYNRKNDQQISVLTDQSNRNVGLDNMAGQIRRLKDQGDETKKNMDEIRAMLQKMQQDRDYEKIRNDIERLGSEVTRLREKTEANAEARTESATRGDDAGAEANERPSRRSASHRSEEHQAPTSVGLRGRESPVDRVRADARLAGERVRQDGTIEGNPFETRMTNVAEQGASGSTQTKKKQAPLALKVVGEPREKAEESKTNSASSEDPEAYIPAGSILTGTIITGADFPTGKGSFENPTPTLIRLQKEAILPNRYTSDIRDCFLLVGGRGDLGSERAKLRSETLSCVRRDGAVIETKFNAYVVGEDGKEGVRGRLVSKQGQMIARSLVAGFASGMSEAFDYDPVPVISTSASDTAQYQKNFSTEAAKGGLAKGASQALERVADFYLDLADQMVPVVEINAGRQVDVVVISSTRLKLKTPPKAVK